MDLSLTYLLDHHINTSNSCVNDRFDTRFAVFFYKKYLRLQNNVYHLIFINNDKPSIYNVSIAYAHHFPFSFSFILIFASCSVLPLRYSPKNKRKTMQQQNCLSQHAQQNESNKKIWTFCHTL